MGNSLGNLASNINKAIKSSTEVSNEIDTTFTHLDTVLYRHVSNIDNNISKTLSLINEYESLYNTNFLAENKIKSAIVNMIIEKIERGYVDDKQ